MQKTSLRTPAAIRVLLLKQISSCSSGKFMNLLCAPVLQQISAGPQPHASHFCVAKLCRRVGVADRLEAMDLDAEVECTATVAPAPTTPVNSVPDPAKRGVEDRARVMCLLMMGRCLREMGAARKDARAQAVRAPLQRAKMWLGQAKARVVRCTVCAARNGLTETKRAISDTAPRGKK